MTAYRNLHRSELATKIPFRDDSIVSRSDFKMFCSLANLYMHTEGKSHRKSLTSLSKRTERRVAKDGSRLLILYE